jgi:hypothetical protein
MFHGYRAIDSSTDRIHGWRVDDRGSHGVHGNTARTVIRCPWNSDEQSPFGRTITRMLVGFDNYLPWEPRFDDFRAFRILLADLYEQGYLNYPGFQPILREGMRGRTNVYGEVTAGSYPHPQFRQPPGYYPRQGDPNLLTEPCKWCSMMTRRKYADDFIRRHKLSHPEFPSRQLAGVVQL